MLRIVLASQNRGKLREIQKILSDLPIELLSLSDFPRCPELEEPHQAYLENAREKAKTVAEFCGAWALADDSGLEVEALGGRPGVLSARFAGESANYKDNYLKILHELEGVPTEKRNALFRCCMVLRDPSGQEKVTFGELRGVIREDPLGENGFGYDPIFEVPPGVTLAQMSMEEKNKISHRMRALEKMKEVIKEILGEKRGRG